MVVMKVIFRTSKHEFVGTVAPDGVSSLAEYLNDLIHAILTKELPEDELLGKLHEKLANYTMHVSEDEKKP
jgi:hypothetical protein